ncbi:MAG: DUF429 domain-containing protein [Thermodesulfobacteriota bacterium]
MQFIGVDSCKKGWFVVAINVSLNWEVGVFENFGKVVSKYSSFDNLLIDIPIGLPTQGSRTCDILTREKLGRRGTSVFTVPCRRAIYSGSYEEACRINLEINGKKLSKQTWNIVPKIKQLEKFLVSNTYYLNKIRESHPEICFYTLSDSKPMQNSKKTEDGIKERLNLMKSIFPKAEILFKYSKQKFTRSEVSKDDIVDALILAISASNLTGNLVSIPQTPPKDEFGIEMEIVYPLCY